MINPLFWLPNIVTSANAAAAEAGEGAAPVRIGFIVLAIIVGPVILLTIASIFEAPRTYRIPGLFIGSLILLIGAIVLSFAIAGVLLGFIVPV